MSFLQQGPVDTSIYLVAGYAVIFVVMLMYLVSLLIRHRNLVQDLEELQKLKRHGD